MELEEKQEILEEFLERWPESKVRAMTLSDYVGVGDKNTFTYWVETKTRALGSIKGWDSIKYGIYRRSKPEKQNKNHQNDASYK
jgi:5-methylcytosine-specific restriction protein B